MRYRRFGRSGLEISEVAFGAGAVGGLIVREGDDEAKLAALRRAVDHGINWVDTAPMYGQGRSEESLGRLLPELGAQPHVSTKVTIDGEHLDDLVGQVERSVHESLERLQRNRVDLVQLHNPLGAGADARTLDLEHVLGVGGVADGLEAVRDQGLTSLIGFTALGDPGDCRAAISSGRFDSAQVYVNLLNPSAGRSVPAGWSTTDFGRLIDACADHDMGVLAIRVMAAGIIPSDARTGREWPLAPGADVGSDEVRMAKAADALDGSGGSRAQAAVRYVLGHPAVSSALVGFSDEAQVDEAVSAVELGALPGDVVDRLGRLYDTDFAD